LAAAPTVERKESTSLPAWRIEIRVVGRPAANSALAASRSGCRLDSTKMRSLPSRQAENLPACANGVTVKTISSM
jgi:hypothetical protein